MLLRPYRMAGAFAFGLMATAFVVLATVMFASNGRLEPGRVLGPGLGA